MDTWKGEKLHGADRRLTRAQLEEMDRVPTLEEQNRARTRGQREQRGQRALVARLARAVSKLHIATGGKGPVWRKAVEAVAGLAR
jgi:hypothetical protein